ncbi:SH3 domain-containing protein [Nesterenkonia sp. AY15]|uniref:SH3 domain-containing protein n=1 Tax=Nesterenkonia sp. AY15 TaxID=2901139 RepID=UPI00237B7073|nr:SH3 domain-containing protein [Nesterenkonia sp. AY15]
MPLTANAAAADTAPMNVAALPTAGVEAPATNLSGLSTVDISATQNATQFRFPLAQRSYTYTSPYGSRCMPTQGASTAHLGQDLGAADGSPIYSVAAGTVVRAFSGNRYNTGFVVVQHQINGRTFHSAYLHMWDAHTHVRVGQAVQAGQTISRVGSSGASTGPHLHLEIWEGAWMHGTSHNPTTWLAQRGVDLRASASFVMNITNPSACNYWTVNSTPLRATASSTGSVIMQLGAGATLTAAPGDTSNGMVRVNANGRIGWVAHSSLTPSRPAGGGTVPAANVPQGTSITPTQYRTTAALNGRSGPGTNYAVLQGLTSGTTVTVTATHGGWMKFSRNGQSVWSHGDFLSRVSTASTGSSNTSAASTGDLAHGVSPASGSYQVKAGVNLVARSNASGSSPIVKVLEPGTRVTLTGMKDTKVRFHDGTQNLWVTAAHLERVTASTTTAASTGDLAYGVSPASGSYQVKAGVNLIARSTASGSSAVVKVLEPGTTVTLTGMKDSKVRFNDGTRNLWVTFAHLEKVTVGTGSGSGPETIPGGTESSGSLAYGVSPASGSYQVKAGVNLIARSTASGSSAVVKVLEPGTTITLTGMKDTKVRFNDGTRNLWVTFAHLEKVTLGTGSGSGPETIPGGTESSGSLAYGVSPASGSYQVKAGVNLNARSTASSTSAVVKVLKPGTTITLNGEKGSAVRFNDGTRNLWVSSAYLEEVTANASTGSSSTGSSGTGSLAYGVSPASGSYQVKAGVNLNARSTASSTSAVVKVLKPGTTITLNGEKGSAVRFNDGTRNLWVSSAYLEEVTANASTGSSSTGSSGAGSLAYGVSPASGSYQVKAGVNLNARSTASSTSAVVKVLKPGTTITLNGEKGSAVRFNDGTRNLWVSSAYLDKATASTGSGSGSETIPGGSESSSSTPVTSSGTYTVKSGIHLNARTGASTSSSTAKVLSPGTKIQVTGEKDEWVSFEDGTRTLWVHSDYLSKVTASTSSGANTGSSSDTGSSSSTGSSAPTNTESSSNTSGSSTSASGTYHVKPNVYLNARSGPGTSHQVVLNLNPLRQFEITGRSGGWVSFVFSGQTVWVDSTYINAGAAGSSGSSSTGSSSSTPTLANSTNSTSKVVGTATTTAQVNVRMGPSTENSTMFSVPTGTRVELLEKKTTGWQEVKVNGATGWMSAQFLTTSDTATSGSGSTTGGSTTGSSGSGTSTAPSTSNMHTKSSNGPYSSAWDKLAQCESGGNWKINTGNGFYGGIQFSPESWKEVGGSGFPHQATRAEQIKRGHMLWKKQGWNAWPHCTSQLGLKGDPGGYGDDYYKVHPSAKTVSSVSAAGTWTASYSVPLREEASTSSDKLVQVPRGTELKQLQREGSWLKVQHKVGGDSYTGWVNTSYISQA